MPKIPEPAKYVPGILKKPFSTNKRRALSIALIVFAAIELASLSLQATRFEIFLQIGGFVGFATPIMIYYYMRLHHASVRESKFPQLLDDMANNLEIGLSLPATVELVKTNNYKSLTKPVRDMHKQMTWGVPFAEAFEDMCNSCDSRLIKKSGEEILSTLKAGGILSKILRGVSTSMNEYEEVAKQRKGEMYEQILTGYMVFFIFLGIIVVLTTNLVPMLKNSPFGQASASPQEYFQALFQFCIVQAICIGLITGEMSEGSIKAGFKHCLVLTITTLVIFAVFSV